MKLQDALRMIHEGNLVEVVRCKDCRYGKRADPNGKRCFWYSGFGLEDYWFCPQGIREDEAK